MSSYREALEATGVTVLAFEEFGSYQGEWWAKIQQKDGSQAWVNGSYGSCSGCDAFQAEFSYDENKCEEHRYTELGSDCPNCLLIKQKYQEKLAEFGSTYLCQAMSQEEAEKETSRNQEYWDEDDKLMHQFILDNKLT